MDKLFLTALPMPLVRALQPSTSNRNYIITPPNHLLQTVDIPKAKIGFQVAPDYTEARYWHIKPFAAAATEPLFFFHF